MKNTSLATRLVLATAAISIGLVAAACSGDAKTDNASTSASETSKVEASPIDGPVATGAPAPPSVPVSVVSEAPISFPALPKGAPKDFPVPSGAKVNPVAGADGSFVLVGEGPEKVMKFYRLTLPEASYKITADQQTSIDFEGKTAKGTVAIKGESVTVTFKK